MAWAIESGEATERLAGIVITLLKVRALVVWIQLANVNPGLMIAFIALAYLEGDVLWLAVAMGLGVASLALDGLAAWEIVHDSIREVTHPNMYSCVASNSARLPP